MCLIVGEARAQSSSGATSDQIQQIMQNLTPAQQQKAQQLLGGQPGSPSGVQSQPAPQSIVLTPAAPQNNSPLPPSRLEQIMSARTGYTLHQFGYDQVGVGSSVTIPQTGAIQDNYVLGPGDEIDVTLRGQENSAFSTTVNRNGQIVLPKIAPLPAAGRTFGDFRQALLEAVHRAYVSTEASVTVGQLRQVTVMVAGEVHNPGMVILTASSTPLDAILLSGGVNKTGSLRNIRVLRGGREIPLDLYGVLTGHAHSSDLLLADGDRVLVPPLGPTVAVAGWVRRQAIYELPPGQPSISVSSLLSLAGGMEVRGKYRLAILRVLPDGRTEMTPLEERTGVLHDSEVLFAQPAADQTISQATLSGGMTLAGPYALKNTKLSELLKAPGALGDSPYTLFGIISRKDPVTRLRTLVAFTPVAVLKGKEDMILQSDDIVRVVSVNEARALFASVDQYNESQQTSDESLRNPQGSVGNVGGTASTNAAMALAQANNNANNSQSALQALAGASQAGVQTSLNASGQSVGSMQYQSAPQAGGQTMAQPQNMPLQQGMATQQGMMPLQQNQPYQPSLQSVPAPGPSQNFEQEQTNPGEYASNLMVMTPTQLASQVNADPLVLMNFLLDHTVTVDGAVRGPGSYLIGPQTDLQSLVMAAGGPSRWADKSAVEVISTVVDSDSGTANTQRQRVSLVGDAAENFIVSPHYQVRLNEVFTDANIGTVTVQGQFRHVGSYQIVRGEHLSDLLLRAGGLTDQAYPYGTVFLRHSAALLEQDAFRREAGEIEDALLVAMTRREISSKSAGSSAIGPDVFVALQSYVNQIKSQKALGRIAIAADPAVLAANPRLDPLLEPGDVVYVPQRPNSVSVLGQVLQPGSIPFKPNMSASDYIDLAGGYGQFADESNTILVLPDGTARSLDTSWFGFGSDDIPPGSTIFVSRDLSGLDMENIIVDTTAVMSQLAITAASLAVLAKY